MKAVLLRKLMRALLVHTVHETADATHPAFSASADFLRGRRIPQHVGRNASEIAKLCLEHRIIATGRNVPDAPPTTGLGSMIPDDLNRSRRRLFRTIATGIPAAVLLRISRARASEKMTRQQAEYRDTPDGIYSCAMCTLFEKPNACKVVEGEISADGWCKAFALLD